MKNQQLAILLAVLIGVISFVGIQLYVARATTDRASEADRIFVYVTTRAIEKGEALEHGRNVRMIPVNGRALENVSKRLVRARRERPDDLTGIAAHGIPVDVLLVDSDIDKSGMQSTIRVENSRRAWTLSVTPNSLHGGQLRPNDWVDVLATFRSEEGSLITRTVLQWQRVLAVNGVALETQTPARGNQVTLALEPEVCEAMELLRAMNAEFSLSLRNPEDRGANPDLYNKVRDVRQVLSNFTVDTRDPFSTALSGNK